MGNKTSKNPDAPENRYAQVSGALYPSCAWPEKRIRDMIQQRKWAPCWPPEDEKLKPSDTECPICFMWYSSTNQTRCCKKWICTECYLHVANPGLPPALHACPFCNHRGLQVQYKGIRTAQEVAAEAAEEERLRRIQEEMQEASRRRDEERRNVPVTTYNPEDFGVSRQDIQATQEAVERSRQRQLAVAEAGAAARSRGGAAATLASSSAATSNGSSRRNRPSTHTLASPQQLVQFHPVLRDHIPEDLVVDSWVQDHNMTLDEVLLEQAIRMSLQVAVAAMPAHGSAASSSAFSSSSSATHPSAGAVGSLSVEEEKALARSLNGIDDGELSDAEETEEFLLHLALALSLSAVEAAAAAAAAAALGESSGPIAAVLPGPPSMRPAEAPVHGLFPSPIPIPIALDAGGRHSIASSTADGSQAMLVLTPLPAEVLTPLPLEEIRTFLEPTAAWTDSAAAVEAPAIRIRLVPASAVAASSTSSAEEEAVRFQPPRPPPPSSSSSSSSSMSHQDLSPL